MKTHKEAYEYISKTSAEQISLRVEIYLTWAQFKYNQNFGNDIIPTLIAAYSGPFDCFENNVFEMPEIKDLNDSTNWGRSPECGNALTNWNRKYCKTFEDIDYTNQIAHILMSGKSDLIYECLQKNSHETRELKDYFPELFKYENFNHNEKRWPRI